MLVYMLRTLDSDGSVNVDYVMSLIQGFQCRNIVKGDMRYASASTLSRYAKPLWK